MRILVVIAIVVVLALAAAIATLALAPTAIALTAAIAVYGSVMATLGITLTVRSALSDRPRLGAEINLEGPYGDRDQAPSYVSVRLYNAGRRPVTIEGIGLWAARAADAPTLPGWESWSNRARVEQLPATLGESESLTVHESGHWIASWYIRHEPARFLFVKPSHGPRQWFELDARTRGFLAGLWPLVAEQKRREDARQAAKAAGITPTEDTSGHGVDPPTTRAP